MGTPSHGSNLVALQSRRSHLAVRSVLRRQRREGRLCEKVKAIVQLCMGKDLVRHVVLGDKVTRRPSHYLGL